MVVDQVDILALRQWLLAFRTESPFWATMMTLTTDALAPHWTEGEMKELLLAMWSPTDYEGGRHLAWFARELGIEIDWPDDE